MSITSPRAVLKDAYAAGVIMDADVWDEIIRSRNVTSHVYDEQTAIEVADRVCNTYLPVLKKLDNFYRG